MIHIFLKSFFKKLMILPYDYSKLDSVVRWHMKILCGIKHSCSKKWPFPEWKYQGNVQAHLHQQMSLHPSPGAGRVQAEGLSSSYKEFSPHPPCRLLSPPDGNQCFLNPFFYPHTKCAKEKEHFTCTLTCVPTHTGIPSRRVPCKMHWLIWEWCMSLGVSDGRHRGFVTSEFHGGEKRGGSTSNEYLSMYPHPQ